MYDNDFYDYINEGAIRSARIILPILFFDGLGKIPESMVDFGCGEGAWLRVAEELGVKTTLGYDGNYVDTNRLLIKNFVPVNLATEESRLSNNFDVAISLEVAEHLPPDAADNFIDLICSASDIVLFSAAIPGQNGVGHVNEQWPGYWAWKFYERGYGSTDALRWLIWNNNDVENWYKQNILVFRKGESAREVKDVVHPNNWYDHYLNKR